MCGIAGYVSPRIQDGQTLLQKMTQRIFHRGPDDGGIYTRGPYGFGMRRLSIIDLKTGHQPLWNEDGTIGVVFNGEIYNFPELRQALLEKGHRFSTSSDTEVIVHLYEEKGIQCLDELNGMFAFALFDFRENQVFLARDRMGEKPLHYYYENGDFVFASEIKSILLFPGIEAEMDLEALNIYLTYEYIPAPFSIYQNIRKLKPGHYLLLKQGKLVEKSYWRPSFNHIRRNFSLEDAIQELRDHIERSVAMRTVSDVPLGAFLSGGLDSSLVTAFLARNVSRRLKTFSIAFEDSSFDESHYAREMASYLGTEHYEEKLTPRKMLEILPRIIEGLDEPFADGSMIPTFLLCQHTRKNVTVALSGDAGDELFAGYPTYQAHKIAQWMPRWAGRPLAKMADLLPVSDENISFDFKMKRFSAGLGYEPAVRNQIWLGAFVPEEKKRLLTERMSGLLDVKDEFSLVKEQWNQCDSPDYLSRILDLDMRFYLQDDILVKVDRMSMANSLEVRVPFLDHKLVEFVCSLESSLKLKGFTTKYILKQAARGIIQDRIIDRPKKGFGIPVARWIKSGLKELIYDTLSENRIREGGLFNPAYVKELLQDHHQNTKDNRKLLWALFIFEAWRQKSGHRGLKIE